MNKRILIVSTALIACWFFAPGILSGVARAQETFKNPAMEADNEFERTFADARRLAREGDPEGAIKLFKKAAKLRNDQCAECYRLIGQVSFQMGRYKDAAAAFTQALALKPENEAALYNALGVAVYMQNDKKALEESVAAFRRAIELDGAKVPKAYYNLGYALFKLGRNDEGVAAFKSYPEADPSTNLASEVRAIMTNPRLAGEKFAPGFKVKSLGGDELSLDKYRGRIVLLDFWATWCGPCIVDMPEVKNIWKKYGGDNFVIIGISLDEDLDRLESYLKKEAISWPQYFDEDSKIAALYGVESIPHTVLVDQDGIVRGVGYRGSALANKIGELIKKIPKAGAGESETKK